MTWSANYRADGLRASKTTGGATTYYLYDRGEPVVEFNSSGTISAVNVFAPDGLVARQQGGSWIYYAFDAQGNVSQRLDSAQNVLSSDYYDAFGVENGNSLGDPFGYHARSGYYLDRENGLYLCQHRYYDPSAGRWITRDPIGYVGGIGLYAYCDDHPVGLSNAQGTQVASLVYQYELPLFNGNTLGGQYAELYRLYDPSGNFLKWGMSGDASKRYPASYWQSGYRADITDVGPRNAIHDQEMYNIENDPGSANREPFRFRPGSYEPDPVEEGGTRATIYMEECTANVEAAEANAAAAQAAATATMTTEAAIAIDAAVTTTTTTESQSIIRQLMLELEK